MVDSQTISRILVIGIGTLLFAAIGVALFVVYPTTTADVVGVLLALAIALIGVKIAANIATSVLPGYDVAEVAVDGPITRDRGRGPIPRSPGGATADEIVEQIDRADDDGNVDALLVRLNTPGGEIVPSDDIKRAVERFEGPTIAYATDVCASGGYWIASGCDELWARDASIVGSIGVVGSRINAKELADRIGISYEGLTAGEYKDAGVPLKEMTDDERSYLQGLVDQYYEHFVERVSDGRNIDAATVRNTEAKVFLGNEAADRGLVDEIGTKSDIEETLAARLDRDEITIEPFEPEKPLLSMVGTGAQRIAYAFGMGIAGVRDTEFRLRT